jgi:hypothetical protein
MSFITDLLTDDHGKFSTSRLWTNLAYIVCSYIMITRRDTVDWMMIIAYAGVVSGSDIAKRVLLRNNNDTSNNNTTAQ